LGSGSKKSKKEANGAAAMAARSLEQFSQGRGRQVERDSENEFCHTHGLFREPGMTLITAARASVCAIQEGAASAD